MPKLTATAPLVLLGAPRSGTSNLAASMHHSGISMGNRFIEADEGNPSGYFEDADFVELHQQFLSRSADTTGHLLEDTSLREEPFDNGLLENDRKSAEALVEKRVNQGEKWGWKDPRTCYYLRLWSDLLPEASYLLTYRHPLETAASLLRLGKNWDLVFDRTLPIRMWTFSMHEVLRFLKAIPGERASIFAAQAMRHSADELSKHLSRKWALDSFTFSGVVEPGVAHPISARQHAAFASYFPEAAETFENLQTASAFPLSLAQDKKSDPRLDLLEGERLSPDVALLLLFDSIQPSNRKAFQRARYQLANRAKDHIARCFESEAELAKAYDELSLHSQRQEQHIKKLSQTFEELLEHSEKQTALIEKLSGSRPSAAGTRDRNEEQAS